jgi:transposase
VLVRGRARARRGCGQRRGRPEYSTRRASRAPTPSAGPCEATTRARRSTEGSDSSSPTPAGLLITVAVLAASRQDRDGGKTALLGAYLTSPVRHVFADQGFAGRLVDWAATTLKTTIKIVRKPADQRGLAVHPRRWVVERTLAWLTAHRRLARDYERHPEVSEAIIRWAAINGMLRPDHPRTPSRCGTSTTESEAGSDKAERARRNAGHLLACGLTTGMTLLRNARRPSIRVAAVSLVAARETAPESQTTPRHAG